MTSKLRIKIGEVEIDCEGTEEFLKQELPQILKTAMELHKARGAVQTSEDSPRRDSKAPEESGEVPSLTTASIAAKLNSKSGGDLLLAASIHLALVKKIEPFTRQQLLTEMQSATSYYKKTYSNNLSKYIKAALVKEGPLSETAKNSFALTAAARASIGKKLADD